MCVFCKQIPVTSPVLSHLLRVHGTLSALGIVCVEPEDGLVTHGADAADLEPFKQAPDRTQTVTVS